ncbi:hypothetical protein [Allofournierella sp.]|uniref:hypothetical protein n=1 Tax=Allofournierella sp. TaxID=1940256 RepID=UPI003AB58F16
MVYRKGPKKRSRWLSYLAYLVVASLVLTGVSMSRYQVTVGGGDTARAAVVAVGNSFSLQVGQGLKPGSSVDMPFTVSNKARGGIQNEVHMEYTLELEHSLNLPLQYTLYEAGADGSAGAELSGAELERDDFRRIVGYQNNVYQLDAYGSAEATQSFILRVQWPGSDDSYLDARYSDELDYTTIRVNAVQRDS